MTIHSVTPKAKTAKKQPRAVVAAKNAATKAAGKPDPITGEVDPAEQPTIRLTPNELQSLTGDEYFSAENPDHVALLLSTMLAVSQDLRAIADGMPGDAAMAILRQSRKLNAVVELTGRMVSEEARS